jgi:sporulation protein YlmC with PRC-barrel domain
MKASEFIGMKVLDKEANEVGKIADLVIQLKKCMVEKIIIATGGTLSKKYFAVVEGDLAEIGDYVQLKMDKESIDQIAKTDKLDDLMPIGTQYKDVVGKIVLSSDAMDIGKIEDLEIDPKGCLIHNVMVYTGGTFSKKHLMIADEDINNLGDYVILKLKNDEVKERIVD